MKHGMKNELKFFLYQIHGRNEETLFSENSKSSKSMENSIVGCYGAHRSYRTSNHIMYIRWIIIFLRSFARNINNKHEMKKKKENNQNDPHFHYDAGSSIVYRLSSIQVHYIWFCFFYFPIILLSLLSSYILPVFYSIRFIPAWFFFGSCLLRNPNGKSEEWEEELFVHIARSTVLAWNPKNVIVSFIFWLNCFDMRTRCLTFSWSQSEMLLSKMLTVQCFGCSLFLFFFLYFFPLFLSSRLCICHSPFAKIC